MSDLLHGARELRQKLYRLEVLLEIEKGGRSRSWFTGKAPQAVERAAAIKRLTDTGHRGLIGPQSQTWVRFPDLGWKVIAAHVSTMNEGPVW